MSTSASSLPQCSQQPERISALSDEGVAHAQAGRLDEAELCFARIVWDWPGYLAGHLNYAEAVRERLRRTDPDDPQVRRRIVQRMTEHYEQAIAAFVADPGQRRPPPDTPEDRKQVAEAIEALEQHIAVAPERWQAAWLHAKALPLLGKDAEAFEAWRHAFERFGTTRDVARDYGLELVWADRVSEAREVNRAITERLPDDATLWCNLAVTELLCGDLDAAERALERSMKLDPADEVARAVKGRLAGYRRGKPLPRTLRELERG